MPRVEGPEFRLEEGEDRFGGPRRGKSPRSFREPHAREAREDGALREQHEWIVEGTEVGMPRLKKDASLLNLSALDMTICPPWATAEMRAARLTAGPK